MSKAFTSEETPDLGPVVRVPPRLAPGEVRYVTPEGQAALRHELAALPAKDPRAAVVERTLAALTVLGPEAAPEGQVGFATWVEVEDAAGARKLFRLVGPDEADPRRGLVSVHAPVGAALLGREVDDTVEVDLPGGRAEYTILAVHRSAPAPR
ncbi:MAG: GreA/GreB family elongation factor [Anaeromyxobacter sp.]